VYLAGPDVFRPDAEAFGRALAQACAALGLQGVFPLDGALPPGLPPADAARHIYQANIRRIESCDAVLAQLDFFRGAEPDSGTCFEVGYAVARGKLVIGHVPEGGALAARIRARQPGMLAADGVHDTAGWRVEEFGLPLNLMLAVPCRIVVGSAHEALAQLRDALAARSTAA